MPRTARNPRRPIANALVRHHRNGVAGEPFHVLLFTDADGSRKLAVRFDGDGDAGPRCAVFDLALLADEEIGSGCNSWRGDQYAPAVDAAIASYEREWASINGEPASALALAGTTRL